MATFTPIMLSGSTNGRPILVAATATPGTLIHTAVASTTGWDQLRLFVVNTHTAAVDLTVEWGGVTDPNDLIVRAFSLPPGPGSSPILLIDGLPINNGLIVRAFASVASKVLAAGSGRRYTA